MNVILNIEIKAEISLSEKIEFFQILKEQLAEHLLDSELRTTFKKASFVPVGETELPNKLDKTIHLKLSVPIELDEIGRRKSPTCYVAKYLDKWIHNLRPDCCDFAPERFSEKTIDLATLSIKKYNEKYKSDLPETFFPGTSYSGIYINPQTRPKT